MLYFTLSSSFLMIFLFTYSCLYSLNFQRVVLCHLQDFHIEIGNIKVKAQREIKVIKPDEFTG